MMTTADHARLALPAVSFVRSVMDSDDAGKDALLASNDDVPDLFIGLVTYASTLRDFLAKAWEIDAVLVDEVFGNIYRHHLEPTS